MQESGLLKRWRWRKKSAELDNRKIISFAKELCVDELVAKILYQRGINSFELAQKFLRPSLKHLNDPTNLPGAIKASKRIAQAIVHQQQIIIYGDYDVDGVTGVSILYHVLAELGAIVDIYIPHRIDEGYGINENAIKELASQNEKMPLIVSVDCGITAIKPAQVAKELGIDLIITDHHTFDKNNLPDCFSLVHPGLSENDKDNIKKEDDRQEKMVEGCGAVVALKLAWQVAREYFNSERLPEKTSNLLVDLLSFAALGMIADVMPLVGENRVLTIFGLGRIKRTGFDGLNALIEAARLENENIDAYHIGFVLGPRLNACGRMGHAKKAAYLLTKAKGSEAKEIAKFLTKENEKRRKTQQEILKEAKQLIEENYFADTTKRAIVVSGENWHPGVVGIVASRLTELYHRPSIVLSVDGTKATGSARSVEGVSIYEALFDSKDILNKFGGHQAAAGLSLSTNNIDTLRDNLIKYVNTKIGEQDLVAKIKIDQSIKIEECNISLFEQLKRLAPFGQGNSAPKLLLENVKLANEPKRMGKNGDHLSLLLSNNNITTRAVCFGMGNLQEKLYRGAYIDLVFKPKVSIWRGAKRAELHVEDIALRPS